MFGVRGQSPAHLIDLPEGRRLRADSSWPCRAEAERLVRMSGYRVAYMIGNVSTESIVHRLGELGEGTT
jgi:hypothetical protein